MLSGFGEWLEEDTRGRFCMLNRRNYTRNVHDWNPLPDMELGRLRGSYFWKGGSRKGGSDEPPEPPPPLVTGLRSVIFLHPAPLSLFLECVRCGSCLCCHSAHPS